MHTHSLALALLLLVPLLPGPGNNSLTPAPCTPAEEEHVCPPCGEACHFVTYAKAGSCGGCGMKLVPLKSVPQVGVLLHEKVDLASSTSVLSVMALSKSVRAFTVADTTDPVRADDALEMRPQFALEDAPALDVLVVPAGYGAWEDQLIVDWVKESAENARFVLSVGTGSLVLVRAGLLEGQRVPAPEYLVRRGAEMFPEVTFDGEMPWKRMGKFYLARDTGAALDAALALLAEMSGEESASKTAAVLGHPWEPVKASEASGDGERKLK